MDFVTLLKKDTGLDNILHEIETVMLCRETWVLEWRGPLLQSFDWVR